MRYKDDKYSLMCAIPPDNRKYFVIFVNDTAESLHISGFFGFYNMNSIFRRIAANEPIVYKIRKFSDSVILKKIHTFDTWDDFLNFENSHPEYFI